MRSAVVALLLLAGCGTTGPFEGTSGIDRKLNLTIAKCISQRGMPAGVAHLFDLYTQSLISGDEYIAGMQRLNPQYVNSAQCVVDLMEKTA